MAEANNTVADTERDLDEVVSRIYEIGYHIIPTVPEDGLEKVVNAIRTVIEKAGGSFIAEGAPALMKLAYDMDAREGDRRVTHDRAYFGWLKFEAAPEVAALVDEALRTDQDILRYIVFKTVREDTRARVKMQVREVRRAESAAAAPRSPRTEEVSAPVSEADLDKALKDLTEE